MFYVREFEFFEEDGFVRAVPYGMGAGTHGENMDVAMEWAADYLYEYVTDRLIDGLDIPEATFGNAPEHGGKVIALAVDCDLSKVDSVTAADAARILGVSRARVSQMCDAGLLQSWKDGAKRLITRDSVNARLEEQPVAGRPHKPSVVA